MMSTKITAATIAALTDLAEAKRLLHELLERIAELEREAEELRRAGKRQATPFSKGQRKARPKKPGQKRGHAAAHRAQPTQVNRSREASLPACCPNCGGAVVEDRVDVQYQVDIPRPIPVDVTQFNVHVGHCQVCQQRVQGWHAEQTSHALGAAGVQIGPNAIGLGIELKHGLGVSYGKAARVLSTLSDLHIQRSTLVRADVRVAEKLTPTYEQLILRLRDSEVVYADETGWSINGDNAWLWVFTNDALSVYVIDASRAHAVAETVLGRDFAGVLSCDCFLAYDPLPYAQNKCAAHLLRRCAEVHDATRGRARRFSQDVARLLRGGILLKTRRAQMSDHGYAMACGRLEAALDRLLDRNYHQPDNARFAKLLRKQRARLFTFLYIPAVEPTNNQAEREIRPAVIVRKTNGCNRSPRGARTHAIVTSVLRTCHKQGRDFVAFIAELLRHPNGVAPSLFADGPALAAGP